MIRTSNSPLLLIFLTSIFGRTIADAEFSFKIRPTKSTFDAHFQQGLCPSEFFQLENECVVFSLSESFYSWNEVSKICSEKFGSFLGGEKTVRIFQLNTALKRQIVEGFYREYEETNFSISLANDFQDLRSCSDGKNDEWPSFCPRPSVFNSSGCFQSNVLTSDKICLRQVDCHRASFKVACEFTVSGNSALNRSTFHHCPKSKKSRRRFSIWAWILIGVGGLLFLLLILGGVLALFQNPGDRKEKVQRTSVSSRSI